MHRFFTLLRQIRFPERAILLTLGLLAGALWAFVAIADEVTKGDTQNFDERVLRALRRAGDLAMPIGPTWLHEVARDVTALGGMAVIPLFALGVLGYLAFAKKGRAAVFVFISVAGGLVASLALKHAFDRQRPSLVPHLDQVYTSSFPSGHSMLSAVTYLTLGALLARTTRDRALKIYFLSVAATLAVLIGASRVYLGVHYPSDVLAGWCAGIAWALLCAVVARALQHARKVEPPAR